MRQMLLPEILSLIYPGIILYCVSSQTMLALKIVQVTGCIIIRRYPDQTVQGSEDIGRYHNPGRFEAGDLPKFPIFVRRHLIISQYDQTHILLFHDFLNIADPADHLRSIDLHSLRSQVIIDKADNPEFSRIGWMIQ